MKHKKTRNFIKIFSLSIIFTLLFNLWTTFIWANSNENTKNISTNTTNFKKINASQIAKSWVAITANLWLRYGDEQKISDIIFRKNFSVSEALKQREKVENEFIIKNMLATKEYFSIMKTDFRNTLKNSKNKEKTLNSIINQLKLRHDIWKKAIQSTATQRTIFATAMEKIEEENTNITKKINLEFRATDTKNIQQSIKKYVDLKEKYYYLRTHVVFADRFLAYYQQLNTYNQNLINALSINKDIIVKGSYLVIPDDGSTILKNYWLLYTEEDYKKELEKQNNNKD